MKPHKEPNTNEIVAPWCFLRRRLYAAVAVSTVVARRETFFASTACVVVICFDLCLEICTGASMTPPQFLGFTGRLPVCARPRVRTYLRTLFSFIGYCWSTDANTFSFCLCARSYATCARWFVRKGRACCGGCRFIPSTWYPTI